jgi:hypothetical protein
MVGTLFRMTVIRFARINEKEIEFLAVNRSVVVICQK